MAWKKNTDRSVNDLNPHLIRCVSFIRLSSPNYTSDANETSSQRNSGFHECSAWILSRAARYFGSRSPIKRVLSAQLCVLPSFRFTVEHRYYCNSPTTAISSHAECDYFHGNTAEWVDDEVNEGLLICFILVMRASLSLSFRLLLSPVGK